MSIYDCVLSGKCLHSSSNVCGCTELTRFIASPFDNPGDIFCVPATYAALVTEQGLVNRVVPEETFVGLDPVLFRVACARIAEVLGAAVTNWGLLTLEQRNPKVALLPVEVDTALASIIFGIAVRRHECALEVISYLLQHGYGPITATNTLQTTLSAIRSAIVASRPTLWTKVCAFSKVVFRVDRTEEWYLRYKQDWCKYDNDVYTRGLCARRYADMYVRSELAENIYLELMGHTHACPCGVSWYEAAPGIYCCLANCLVMNSGCRVITRVIK